MTQNMSDEIRAVFLQFDSASRGPLEDARATILEIAAELEPVRDIEESLKWGQPSYQPKPKTGTPIRLGVSKSGAPTLFVHCQTTLVADLAADNVHDLATIDNRAVVLPKENVATHPGLRGFIRAALTYHL